MSYKVKLPVFEGPFDLLVYLIQNAKMSIYDIEISEITAQYLDYINQMKDTDFEMASEFMVLAATMLKIKSEMILPKPESTEDNVIEEDPRTELVEKILEYKKAKYGAELLEDRFIENEKVYTKPAEDISCYVDNPDEYLNLDLPKFVQAFQSFMERKIKEDEVKRRYVTIEKERETIENRMDFIRVKLKELQLSGEKEIALSSLVPTKKTRYDMVISFISILQLIRDNMADAKQPYLFGEIMVIPAKELAVEKGQ